MDKNKFKFEKLIIWLKSMDFGEFIDQMPLVFPDREKFNLASQTCRAPDSIALSISEGANGQSNLEQKKFIGYATRSLAEFVTCPFKAKRGKYISHVSFLELYNEVNRLMNMMVAFWKKTNFQYQNFKFEPASVNGLMFSVFGQY